MRHKKSKTNTAYFQDIPKKVDDRPITPNEEIIAILREKYRLKQVLSDLDNKKQAINKDMKKLRFDIEDLEYKADSMLLGRIKKEETQ